MKEILKDLNKIDFHDIPVESVRIISDPETLVIISFFLFNNNLNNYQKNEIIFNGIEKLEIGNIILDSESNIEIYRFIYEFKEKFHCNMTFLMGFGKPDFEIKIICKTIEIRTVPINV